MKPKVGFEYLATADHFAAESSAGTSAIVCTTDDFTKSVHALGFYAAPKGKERKIATRTSSSTATSSMAERCSARF